MKIVFLGCGYLGYNLYVLLKDRFQAEIWGIDSPYVPMTDSFRYVDALNPEELSKMDMEDAVIVDTIALVANDASDINEAEALEKIFGTYRELLKVVKEGHARRFVFFSSGGTVYGDSHEPICENSALHPVSLYAKSKAGIEEVIRNSGADYLILRLSNPFGGYQVAGKRQGVIPILIRKAYLNETFEMWASDDSVRDYFYITDLAEAIAGLIQNDVNCETVNVGSGEPISLSRVIYEVEKSTGKEIKVEYKKSSVHVVQAIVLNIDKLKSLTGYEPKVSFEEGVRLETERIRKELGL
ncbi:MAG: NAD-dependent epimerase/dehydratase family protein [Solobacterium sp.]|nr:NAD-dependent epimerase/dehydratase family protein [Solobacterium sp.]